MLKGGNLKVISFGGGVQSTAMIVLATQGLIPDVDAALFANVGDDSEHPATIKFVKEIAIPWAEERNIKIHVLSPLRHKQPTTLYSEITKEGSRRDLIPVFGEAGNPLSRSCTADFKVRTLHRWLRENGATRQKPAYVQLGISTDEIQRAGRGKNGTREIREYPLLDLGLSRTDCMKIISDAGLPVPPKSSCFFCPFHSEDVWRDLRKNEPELFEKAQYLEDFMKQRKADSGLRTVYLTRKGAKQGKRLSELIPKEEGEGFESEIGSDGCDSGYCWT